MLQLAPAGVLSAVELGMAMCMSGEQVQHCVHAHTGREVAASGALYSSVSASLLGHSW